MRKQNSAQATICATKTQFELSKIVLNNLYKFDLKPITKLVLIYLCDCYNPKNGCMFPKQKTIADKLGVSEVSVIRAVQELHKEGLIISERKYINVYRFTSKILSEYAINEHKKMIGETYQIEKEPIKMIAPCIEQRKEQKKNTSNDKILLQYAEKRGVKNKIAYINAIKRNGGDKQIINEFMQVEKRKEQVEKQTQETLKHYEEIKNTGVAPTQAFLNLKEKLKKLHSERA